MKYSIEEATNAHRERDVFVKKIYKIQHLEGSGTPVLYIGRIVLNPLTLRRLMSYIYIYIYIYMEHPFLMFLDHTQ